MWFRIERRVLVPGMDLKRNYKCWKFPGGLLHLSEHQAELDGARLSATEVVAIPRLKRLASSQAESVKVNYTSPIGFPHYHLRVAG